MPWTLTWLKSTSSHLIIQLFSNSSPKFCEKTTTTDFQGCAVLGLWQVQVSTLLVLLNLDGQPNPAYIIMMHSRCAVGHRLKFCPSIFSIFCSVNIFLSILSEHFNVCCLSARTWVLVGAINQLLCLSALKSVSWSDFKLSFSPDFEEKCFRIIFKSCRPSHLSVFFRFFSPKNVA